MSIRSTIAFATLGCILMSAPAVAEPTKQPAKDRPDHANKGKGKPGQATDAATAVPADGTLVTDPVTGAQTMIVGGVPVTGATGVPTGAAPGTFHQLGCNVLQVSTPPVFLFMFTNSTPAPLPAGTLVWVSPTPITSDAVMPAGTKMHMDGTSAAMDVYIKLGSELPAGGTYQPMYTLNTPWSACSAAAGMAAVSVDIPIVE